MDNRTYFQSNPVKLDVSRSTFPLDHKMWTTFNAGELVPLLLYSDVLPGDTFELGFSFVLRSTTPRAPIMDDAEIQVEFYFVPHEFVLHRASMTPAINDSNHSFSAFMGAQDNLLNVSPGGDIELPSLLNEYYNQFDGATLAAYKKSPAMYFGMPFMLGFESSTDYDGGTQLSWDKYYFNPLKVLAFYKVWSDNYRDPNLNNPVTYSITSGNGIFFIKNDDAGFKYSQVGGVDMVNLFKSELPHVSVYHGYFGSLLPWPQRNSTAVTLPLGDKAPVIATATTHDLSPETIVWKGSGINAGSTYPLMLTGSGNDVGYTQRGNASSGGTASIRPQNLWADLSSATAATINTIRAAFALQRWYEQLARGGNARLSDLTAVMFGVTPHNIGDDKCVYLGGKRIPISQTMVAQTTPTASKDLGTLGAYSNTSDATRYFVKSFDTWGTIVGVACVRHHTTISVAISKMDKRKTKFDYYWPQMSNLGEVETLVGEYAWDYRDGTQDDEMGFQEYAADYRYFPDRVYGEFIPNFGDSGDTAGGLSYLTYADENIGANLDLKTFIDASRQVEDFDRTLVTTSTAAGYQYALNGYFKIKATRPMPLYSIPGLLDHH